MYHAKWNDGTSFDVPVSKLVCVGRNYAEHAKELGNEIPDSPILFIKPESSIQEFDSELVLPRNGIHYEAELAFLVGEEINNCTASPLNHIAGVGLALDLTDRELQSSLKSKGHPWERAKSFNGAAVITQFESVNLTEESIANMQFAFLLNGKQVQKGMTTHMLFNVEALLSEIAKTFTLRRGDIILTGTPEGVGTLNAGDVCALELLTDEAVIDYGEAGVRTA